MQNIRKGSHTTHQLHVHLVWSTKYRYEVLRGDIQVRCRDLIRQTCDSLDIQILKGVVSKDHIHFPHLAQVCFGPIWRKFVLAQVFPTQSPNPNVNFVGSLVLF